jgi:hypothetical protein
LIVAIHQPEHLPWLGFFHKMKQADYFVILDNVKFRKQYFQNRNRILTANKTSIYLTVPLANYSINREIKDVEISSDFDKGKYLRTLYYSYKNHPYFEKYYPDIKNIISQAGTSLLDLNLQIIRLFRDALGITTPLIMASELNVTGAKTMINLNICKALNAQVYLSGPSGKDYLDESLFHREGIAIQYHSFNHPTYPQRNSDHFVSHLSTIDLLFNCGDESKTYFFNS